MPTVDVRSASAKLTEEDVLQLIAEALDVARSKLNSNTKAADISEWDSMGILSILSSLDRASIKCDINRTESLTSVGGVIEVCRSSGRLE